LFATFIGISLAMAVFIGAGIGHLPDRARMVGAASNSRMILHFSLDFQ
jgi:hypothetical protein